MNCSLTENTSQTINSSLWQNVSAETERGMGGVVVCYAWFIFSYFELLYENIFEKSFFRYHKVHKEQIMHNPCAHTHE